MSPAEATVLLELGLKDGDFRPFCRLRKKSEIDTFQYAFNQAAKNGLVPYALTIKDWRDVIRNSPVADRYEVRLHKFGDKPGELKPAFTCNTVSDMRGFIIGVLAMSSIPLR
jgi:hypothetical protein